MLIGSMKGNWHGTLRARLVIFSNELLRFQDESGALADRFLTWRSGAVFLREERRP